jgi:undecaprenyl diphosphate synthase
VKDVYQEVADNYSGDVERIDEEMIAKHLMTGFLPIELRDPELLIRTSGEERISNFLLWQIAYSELFFTDALWPDFNELLLETSIASFQNRDRRFGGLKHKEEKK